MLDAAARAEMATAVVEWLKADGPALLRRLLPLDAKGLFTGDGREAVIRYLQKHQADLATEIGIGHTRSP